jgi:hypothetical protein
MTKRYIPLIGFFLLLALSYTNAITPVDTPKVKTGIINLQFRNIVDGKVLKLNDPAQSYHNDHGDDFKLSMFKYYISNVSLKGESGLVYNVPNSYYLINASDTASLNQQIASVPQGKYTDLSFTIGVDSLRNFAGAQTGALDPAQGMFWTGNSGYIFLKFEGESSKSTAKKNRIIFHIGGASAPYNAIRPFTQHFQKPLLIARGKSSKLEITANAAALFRGKTIIDFSKLNLTMGGPNSVIIADNYAAGLFTITNVIN